ncbi:coq1 putative hexaprenyl diphosphate synthase [Coemansia helicoidea]|uniref:Coq1 putative hexaprenyl diphosphate synthase n=1 Tax=Coemansia helicoidea TaxID=1286919 RepID=A0ACC1LHQ9_9FUNG|nr:coq1 putative hexaprenyl diphosphate synthase [Coemansia helicoidea]
MAAKARAALGRLGAFARNALGRPSESRPLDKLAVGSDKAVLKVEIETTGLRETLPGPQSPAMARLREPIRASDIQAPSAGAGTREAASAAEDLDQKTKVAGDRERDRKPVGPKELVGPELSFVTDSMVRLLESGHPMLNAVSQYYFAGGGKHVGPMLVMLIAQAASIGTRRTGETSILVGSDIDRIDFSLMDRALSQNIDSDRESQAVNQLVASATRDSNGGRPYEPSVRWGLTILPTQRRLAEITELIHTASLLHDDVIDHAETRRGLPAIQRRFGNKMAIFAGDFLLARASMALARLRDPEVIEIMSSVLSDLVDGEFKQLQNLEDASMAQPDERAFEYYLDKTYLKTASLLAKSCRSSALLGNSTDDIAEAAHLFGRNIGIAYQLIDDLLDFTVSSAALGKPVGADLELGLATAPVLYAWQEHPELGPLVARRFSADGDVQTAWRLVHASSGIDRTRALAHQYAQRACEALAVFPQSHATAALEGLAASLLRRSR